NDLVVNPLKGKQLTNMRAAGKDENLILTPPIRFSLEQALEFIDDDALVEVTPDTIRLRKRKLLEHDRKRASRASRWAERLPGSRAGGNGQSVARVIEPLSLPRHALSHSLRCSPIGKSCYFL